MGLVLQRRILSDATTLKSYPGFQWFLDACLDVKIRENEVAACDVTKSDEECRIARHVLGALRDVRTWVERREASATEYLKSRSDSAPQG